MSTGKPSKRAHKSSSGSAAPRKAGLKPPPRAVALSQHSPTRKTTAQKRSKTLRPRPLSRSKQEAYIAEIRSIVKKRGAAMRDFRVGDVVVEPSIGVCRIEGITSQRVDDRTEDFYIFNSGSAKVYVPVSQIERRGVRRPMSREEIKRVYTQLRVPVQPTRGDARLQYLSYREVMRSGEPLKISRLLRELYTLDKMDELKGKEKEIMEQAKKFLADEISYIRDDPKQKVMDDIQESLEQMYKRKVSKDREARARRATAAS